MRRYLTKQLVKWKESASRLPLLLCGARQTGKTYLVEDFGQKYFDNIVIINFELNPEYKLCFKTLQPAQILLQLRALTHEPITAGQTLLFLDEIQECPEAIQALRYFKEQISDLHIIGAGSLLEFALKDGHFSMPVGRVEFLYLYPMNFIEFLYALGEDAIVEIIQQANFQNGLPEAIHARCLELLRWYALVGGMPAVVNSYIKERDFERIQNLQINLLATYRNDFGKYASHIQQKYCQVIFNKMPNIFSKHCKYVDIDPTIESRYLKSALSLMIQAGILTPVYQSLATGLPLNANINEKKFKLLFFDTGLMKAAGKLDSDLLLSENFMDIRTGALAEQLVGQQLLTYQPPYDHAEIFYWQRDKKGSQAEVDYLVVHRDHIIPLEVKAGSTGRLRSLHLFMEHCKSPYGIRLSTAPLKEEGKVLSIPIYMLSEVYRLLAELPKKSNDLK